MKGNWKLTFGENLRRLRERVAITQDQLAYYLHITHQSISKWENNISLPSIEFCIPLTNLLKCTLEELFLVFKKEVDI